MVRYIWGVGAFRLGLWVGCLLYGQAPTVFIENADELGGTAERRTLRGNVILRQDTVWLYCTEAALEEGGRFTAQGATRTQVGRTGTIYAERLLYDPSLQRLTYEGSVRAVFPPTTFEAPRLHYDRATETLFYEAGGRLQDTAGTIQSRRCTYHVPTETAHFGGEVRLLRGSARVLTDSLIYEVRTGLARFPGAIEAYDTLRRDSLYAGRGQANRHTGELYLADSVVYWDSLRYISAQAAYLAGSRDSGEAYCDVQYRARSRDLLAWADTAIWARGALLPLRALRPVERSLAQEDTAALPTQNTLLLYGNAALLWREAASAPRRPSSESGLSSDSLRGDTLFMPSTASEGEATFLQAEHLYVAGSRLWALREVELLQAPLAARSDTLCYDTTAHFAQLRGRSWLADTAAQLWAEAVDVRFVQSRPDSAWAAGKVRLLLRADTMLRFFHQVHSDSLEAAWGGGGTLRALLFRRGVQLVYYQSDGPYWQGGHYLRGQGLRVELDSLQRPAYVRLTEKPVGTFWPVKTLLDSPLWIAGSRWLWPWERPQWPFRPSGASE